MSTVAELRELLDARGVAYKGRDTKATLEKLLEDSEMNAEAETVENDTAEQPKTEVPQTPADKRATAEKVFNEMIDAGKSKDEVIDAIVDATGSTKTYAKAIYDICVDVSGKRAEHAPRGGKADAFVIFDKHIAELKDVEDLDPQRLGKARKAAIEEALEKTGLKKLSLDAHMRAYLKDRGFALASPATRGNTEEKEKLIKEMLDAGKPRKDILAALIEKYGHTESGAAATYQNICKRNEWGQTRDSGKQPACWDWFKENHESERKEAIAKFMELGASALMSATYWATFSKAKELALDLCGQVDVEE